MESQAELWRRIADGRTDLVFEFLKQDAANTSHDGVTLIQWCAYYGDVSAVRQLLLHGADLSALGPNLDLNGAAFHGHWRLCQFLLEQGASPRHADPETGETALHNAVLCSGRGAFAFIVKLLLAAGAEPNQTTRPGVPTGSFMRDVRTRAETPLHRAAAFASEEVIRLLLDGGADRGARDAYGDSPLGWASLHQRPAHILELLCWPGIGVHPAAAKRARELEGRGWGAMEDCLLGKPHF